MSDTVMLAVIGVIGQAILAVIGLYGLVLNGRLGKNQNDLHHQLNSLTDARVVSAGQIGHAEGMLAGQASEQDRVAKMIAATVAIEVAKKLEEAGMPAIQVKPVKDKS